MRILIMTLSIVILFSLISFTPTSARFFPNVSSILPPNATASFSASAWDSFHKLNGSRAGQKLDGLAKLKQYLHHFGYIRSSVSNNFTDDFDDFLENALKTYQKNFNLNITGELDRQTLDQIVRPRCGNPDIINGTTSMNSGKETGSFVFHTVSHYTYFSGTPRWPDSKRNLTYAFLPGNGLTDDVKSVFSRAFNRWATVIPMTFTETELYEAADIRIGFYRGDHGHGEPFDGVLGILAHAFSPPRGMFHLDGDENWVVSGDVSSSALSSAVDLESVAVHEIGHVLGLGHSSVKEAIMYPTLSSKTRKVELASDDVVGIQRLYGGNPNYNGSATTSVKKWESSGVYSGNFRWGRFQLLVVVGFVMMVL